MAKRKVKYENQIASSWVCARQVDCVIRKQERWGARPVSELLSVPLLSGPLANRERPAVLSYVLATHN